MRRFFRLHSMHAEKSTAGAGLPASRHPGSEAACRRRLFARNFRAGSPPLFDICRRHRCVRFVRAALRPGPSRGGQTTWT